MMRDLRQEASAILKVDLTAIQQNWQSLDRLSSPDTETAAVVKADGYGLGAAEIARCLYRVGTRSFFVAQAKEGAVLRETLPGDCRIFVLNGHMRGDTALMTTHQLIPLLNSTDQFARHRQELSGHPFGLQLNTGMNRLGLDPEELSEILSYEDADRAVLVMSHLACADEPGHAMNAYQLKRFHEMTHGLTIPRSLAATGGILLADAYHFSLTRPGIGLYGCLPFSEARPVVTLDLPVIQTRTIANGESVGYGAQWKASRPCRIATISAGYADGIFRRLGDRASLWYEQQECPIVGRISMDLITVDVSSLNCEPSYLQLFGAQQSVDDLAIPADTIGYEMLTSLGSRYNRAYGTV